MTATCINSIASWTIVRHKPCTIYDVDLGRKLLRFVHFIIYPNSSILPYPIHLVFCSLVAILDLCPSGNRDRSELVCVGELIEFGLGKRLRVALPFKDVRNNTYISSAYVVDVVVHIHSIYTCIYMRLYTYILIPM